MQNDHSALVVIQDLTHRFEAVTAVDRLSLTIPRGEIVGLVGPDGAGKTTTLRLLCGLLNPTEGKVWVVGRDLSTETDAVKDHIGYMAQRFGLYSDLTVRENMDFYADLFGVSRSERAESITRLLRMTRMKPFVDRAAGKLSGGMKQKLALMCTLLHRPEILFLDEPTNGVDPVSRRDFWLVLRQLVQEGMTVLVTTTYLDEAERCDRLGLMHQGRLIRLDTPQKLKSDLEDECYEVESSDQRAALALLRGLEGITSVEPAGAVLHLFLSPRITASAAVERALEQEGLRPATVRKITPSLEDVFILLIRQEEHS